MEKRKSINVLKIPNIEQYAEFEITWIQEIKKKFKINPMYIWKQKFLNKKNTSYNKSPSQVETYKCYFTSIISIIDTEKQKKFLRSKSLVYIYNNNSIEFIIYTHRVLYYF